MDSELEKTKDISKLDHIRSKLEIQKLEYEVSSYKYKLSKAYRFFEFLKQISASLGILTALTGIVALTFSFYQWKHQTEQNRMVRVEERLDKALSGLSNEITGKRLSSVSSLKIFLRPVYEEHHEKILQALILTLAIDKDSIVRNSIIEVLTGNTIESNVSQNIKVNILKYLVSLSRSLVREGKLGSTRVMFVGEKPSQNSIEDRAQDLSKVITHLLQRGINITNLKGIYCVGCDLSSLELPGASFDNAILFSANFTDSILRGASFIDSDIFAAKFTSADLRNSNFSLPIGITDRTFFQDLFQRIKKGQRILVSGPDFSCADLRNSNFSGFPVFNFYEKGLKNNLFAVTRTDFRETNLRGAKFNPMYQIVFTTNYKKLPFWPSKNLSWHSLKEFAVVFYLLDDNSSNTGARNFDVDPDYFEDLQFLKFAFAGANWWDANLPRSLKQWFETNRPPVGYTHPPYHCKQRVEWRRGYYYTRPKDKIAAEGGIKKVSLIEWIRTKTKWSVKESNEFVEAIQKELEKNSLDSDNKITLIKWVKSKTGWSLMESKEFVEVVSKLEKNSLNK